MITVMLMLSVFVLGFLAAYVDWHNFLSELFLLQNLNNLGYFVLSFTMLLLSYYLFLYIPASIFVVKTSSKFRDFILLTYTLQHDIKFRWKRRIVRRV